MGLVYWLLIQQTTTLRIFYEIFAPQKIFFTTYTIAGLLSMLFFGLNVAVAVTTWKTFKSGKLKQSGVTGVSAVVSLFGASCPACGAFLLSFVGLSTFAALLPYRGLEFQFIALPLLAGTFWFSWRKLKKGIGCEDCSVEDNLQDTPASWIIHLAVWLVILSSAYFLLQKELLM